MESSSLRNQKKKLCHKKEGHLEDFADYGFIRNNKRALLLTIPCNAFVLRTNIIIAYEMKLNKKKLVITRNQLKLSFLALAKEKRAANDAE